MIGDYLGLALIHLTHRKLRSWLTLIGIFIGIAAVVSLISIGQGLEDSIQQQAQQVGADRIIITPGGGGGGVAGVMLSEYSTAKLTDKDVDTVRSVNGIDYAIGVVVQFVKVEFDGEAKETQVFATSVDPKTTDFIKQVDYFVVDEGRYLREGDVYKATIGKNIAEEMFKKPVKIGDKSLIEGISFDIVGINKLSGNPFHDDKITLPLDTAREMFGKKEKEVQMIMTKVQKGFTPSKVAEDVKKRLRRERGVKEDEEDFSVQTAEQMIKSFTSVLDIVRYVLVGIASISLVVGGVGIMNTMYTSVIERTHQIGIMKAVGARNSDIMQVFLVEAGLLGFVGGVIGCGFGLLISKIAEFAANQALGSDMLKAYVSWDLIAGALLFSFIVGSISGVFPARKAALLKPVDALRFH
jgi:putative ABC transport system permease protein